jgi:hypothetical protein
MRKLNVHTVASLEKEARLNSFGGLWSDAKRYQPPCKPRMPQAPSCTPTSTWNGLSVGQPMSFAD